MILREAWSIWQVPGQPELHRETQSQKQNKITTTTKSHLNYSRIWDSAYRKKGDCGAVGS